LRKSQPAPAIFPASAEDAQAGLSVRNHHQLSEGRPMPASNDFQHFTKGLTAPGDRFWTIVPNDAADLSHVTRAINVSVSGPVRVTTAGGDEVTLQVVAGIAFPGMFSRIWATGTNAGTIVGIR
jgi:hypothetical protein